MRIMLTYIRLKLTNDAALRGTRDENGVLWFSVYDCINFVCNKEPSSSYSCNLFKKLLSNNSKYQAELMASYRHQQTLASYRPHKTYHNRAFTATPCMTFEGLQRFLVLLENNGTPMNAEHLAVVNNIFRRFFCIDDGLAIHADIIEEINPDLTKVAEAKPAPEPCAPAVPAGAVPAVEHDADAAVLGKRKELEQLDLEEQELALEERRLALARRRLALTGRLR